MYEDIVRNIETAIANGRTDIVLALIENYKKSKVVDKEETPLKSFLNSYLSDGGSFLQLATKLNQTDIARALLLYGSDPGFQDVQGRSAVDLASKNPQMIALYQQELLRVIALSDISQITQLLNAGVDINCQDSASSGNTPLHWAVTFSDLSTVSCLLERGADVNATNCIGASPLYDAVVRGDLDIVQELLQHGADLTIKAGGKFSNQTLFDLAAGCPEILMALRDQFDVPNPENDVEQHSDSTSSSWVNAYGSRESLIMVDNEPFLSSSILDSPPPHNATIVIEDNLGITTIPQSPVARIHDSIKHSNKTRHVDQKWLKLLWPIPRCLELHAGESNLSKNMDIYFVENQDSTLIHKVMKLWRMHKARLSKAGYTCSFKGIHSKLACSGCSGIICQINPNMFPNKSEAYTLSIMASQIQIVAADISGLFYAICFLVQFLTLHYDQQDIPHVRVMDWPTWSCRGTVVNISHNKPTPKLESILTLVDSMSYFRLNHLFLVLSYEMESSAEAVFSSSDILRLDEYCKDRCLMLLPGFELETAKDEHFQLEHLYRMISQCLSHFSSRRYFYFGPNATNLLRKVSNECGNFPDLPIPLDMCLYLDVSGLREDSPFFTMLPLNVFILKRYDTLWDKHETSSFQHKIAAKGTPCGIMANVMLTDSVTGCSEVLLGNFQRLASSLSNCGSSLFLSHALLPESISLSTFQVPGMVFGAGLAWNPHVKLSEFGRVLADILDTHAFERKGFGELVIRLSTVESTLAGRFPTAGTSFLYRLIVQPNGIGLDGLTPENLQKSVRDIKLCMASLPSEMSDDNMTLMLVEEIQFVADLLLFSCRLCRNLLITGKNPNPSRSAGLSVINVGLSNLPPTNRTDLANRLLELTHSFQKLWLRRNLPGGLHSSLQTFNRLFHQLIPKTGSDNIISI